MTLSYTHSTPLIFIIFCSFTPTLVCMYPNISTALADCTQLMRTIMHNNIAVENPAWLELLEKINLLDEQYLSSPDTDPKIKQSISQSIAAIKASYQTQFNLQQHKKQT